MAVRDGDLRAFDALYDRYERRLFGYLRRVSGERDLAEDLFQDVFPAPPGFDPEEGALEVGVRTSTRLLLAYLDAEK